MILEVFSNLNDSMITTIFLVFNLFFFNATFFSVSSLGEMEDSAVEHIILLLLLVTYFRYLSLYQSPVNGILESFCV